MANDSKGYYKILGLEPGADLNKVKAAYRKKQAQLHPSGPERRKLRNSTEYKNMSAAQQEAKEKELDELISQINVAYSVLGDDEKKKDYDNGTGEFGAFNFHGADGAAGFEDIFSTFMGGGRRGNFQKREQKVSDTITNIKINIHQAYTGKTSKFKVQTTRVCKVCSGKGYASTQTCSQCKGNGRVYIQRNLGMMITRQEAECNKCNGQGIVGSGPKCNTCNGQKVIREPFVIEVKLRPGIKDGESIIYQGQGNHEPGKKPGDLVFKVNVNDDAKYKRIGDDLIVKTDVDIYTVLVGGIIYFDHLDGRKLGVSIPPIKNIKDAVMLISEGFKKETMGKGNLYLDLNIIINRNINKTQLSQVLPPSINKPYGQYSNINGSFRELPKEKESFDRQQHHYEDDYEGSDNEFDARQFFRGGFSFF